jgi:hypothetical protein
VPNSFTHLAARSREPQVRGTLYLGVYQTGSSSVSEFLTPGPTAFAARLSIHLFTQASSIRYAGVASKFPIADPQIAALDSVQVWQFSPSAQAAQGV